MAPPDQPSDAAVSPVGFSADEPGGRCRGRLDGVAAVALLHRRGDRSGHRRDHNASPGRRTACRGRRCRCLDGREQLPNPQGGRIWWLVPLAWRVDDFRDTEARVSVADRHDPVRRRASRHRSRSSSRSPWTSWVDGDGADGVRHAGLDTDHRPSPAVGRGAVRPLGGFCMDGAGLVILGISFPEPDRLGDRQGHRLRRRRRHQAWRSSADSWPGSSGRRRLGRRPSAASSTSSSTRPDPNVQADWFITGTAPTPPPSASAPPSCCCSSWPGSSREPERRRVGMLRRMALELPVSVLGMAGLVTVHPSHPAHRRAVRRDHRQLQDDISGLHRRGPPSATSRWHVATARSWCSSSDSSPCWPGSSWSRCSSLRSALIYIVVALAPIVFATPGPPRRGRAASLDLLVALDRLEARHRHRTVSVAAAAGRRRRVVARVTALPEPEVRRGPRRVGHPGVGTC